MAANGVQQEPGKFTQLVELMRDSVITQASGDGESAGGDALGC